MLADAGYADTDGDGFVETPRTASPIELTLIVPDGLDRLEGGRG